MSAGTVLLVEDNPLTRRFVRRALEREGCEVVEAEDAAGALGLIARERVDLVLQDLVLPDMSGFDLVQRLREHPAGRDAAILAFSGLLTDEDEERITAAGFDGVIMKPIEPLRLGQLVRGHLPEQNGRPAPFGQGKLLVVVDDDGEQLKLARFRLGRLGFLVAQVPDAGAALAAMRGLRPHAVVSKAFMPRLDGFGLCLALRDDPELSQLPVVLVAEGAVEAGDRELAERVGASALVPYRADFSAVIAELERLSSTAAPRTAWPATPGDADPLQMERARSDRALRQLERQAALNAHLQQRCSTLDAELSVLGTVADALVDVSEIEAAMLQILVSCLDVMGASRGAICVAAADGSWKVHASHSFADARWVADLLAANRPLRERLLESRMPTSFGELLGEHAAVAGDLAGVLVVALIARGKLSGALLIEAPGRAANEDWKVFAHTIGGQVSLALSLARAFSQVGASEQRSRALMENAADAIFVSNEDGLLLEVNRAGEALLGLPASRIVTRFFREFLRDEPLEQLAGQGRLRRLECSMIRSDGSLIPVELSSTPVAAGSERLRIFIVRDVSERNALADQLRHAQKMEAMGRLAGGVAHDFNNTLSVVLSFSELALRSLPSGDPVAVDIAEIKKAGENAADLTRQLLAFSRQELIEPRVLLLDEVVESMENMLRRLIGANIALTTELLPQPAPIRADLGQVHQVILNLIVNARDAMPDGGRLKIAVTNREVAADAGSVRPGSYVVLEVVDSGIGMDAATRARIFEPFFTTKRAGLGTGLGLATVSGIVEQSEGFVRVESEPGQGTTFQLYFPRADVEEVAAVKSSRPRPLYGSERVLVVEDGEQVRAAVRSILERYGYTVLEAGDAEDALRRLEEGTPVELLVTDVVLPRMGGFELARLARRARPELKVLCISGYSADAVSRGGAEVGVPVLPKPITPASLTRKVREVLDRPPIAREDAAAP